MWCNRKMLPIAFWVLLHSRCNWRLLFGLLSLLLDSLIIRPLALQLADLLAFLQRLHLIRRLEHQKMLIYPSFESHCCTTYLNVDDYREYWVYSRSRWRRSGLVVAGIGDGEFGNKAKKSSDRGKNQAKTAKSKKPQQKPEVFWVPMLLAYFLKNLTHDQEFLAILEAPWIETLLFKALSFQQNLSFNLQHGRWAPESFWFHITIYPDSLPFQVSAFKLHLFRPPFFRTPHFVRLPPRFMRLSQAPCLLEIVFSSTPPWQAQALRFLQILARPPLFSNCLF